MSRQTTRIVLRTCSFCGHIQESGEIFYVKEGGGAQRFARARQDDDGSVCICKTCIEQALVTTGEEYELTPLVSRPVLTPERIEEILSMTVRSQQEAKRTLAIAAWQHTYRMSRPPQERWLLPKNNILIVGPTGTGKTLLLETLSRIIDVPMITVDASAITKAGYIGDKAAQCIYKLVDAAGSVERATKGIVYFDEVDKICNKRIIGDVGGEAAQQSLLKIIEGTTMDIGKEKISTKDILFVATGAFPELYERHTQDSQRRSIGFLAQQGVQKKELESVTTAQLVACGMIPEFLRRFPSTVAMKELSVHDLEDILSVSKRSPLAQYVRLIRSMGIRTVWSKSFIQEAARRAHEKKIGASGLQSVLERSFRDLLFVLPSKMRAQKGLIIRLTSQFFDDGHVEYVYDGNSALGTGEAQ